MKPHLAPKNFIAGAAVLAACLLAYGGYRYYRLHQYAISLAARVADLEGRNAGLAASLASTTDSLASTTADNSNLSASLDAEQHKNNLFESQIQDISGTVGTLKKLSQIDPQLLEKYSRVYFLNENYAPDELSSIGAQYLYNKNSPQLIRSGVLPYLTSLIEAAKRDGATLQIASAYRSFAEQLALKLDYTTTYGADAANQFSADQGYSEHQLGTAVDFATPEEREAFRNFDHTAAYAWLVANAYRYGFAISYPQGNTYYEFEPWHWRFVGVALATALHNQNEYFYNMTQRDINQYLISIFN